MQLDTLYTNHDIKLSLESGLIVPPNCDFVAIGKLSTQSHKLVSIFPANKWELTIKEEYLRYLTSNPMRVAGRFDANGEVIPEYVIVYTSNTIVKHYLANICNTKSTLKDKCGCSLKRKENSDETE